MSDSYLLLVDETGDFAELGGNSYVFGCLYKNIAPGELLASVKKFAGEKGVGVEHLHYAPLTSERSRKPWDQIPVDENKGGGIAGEFIRRFVCYKDVKFIRTAGCPPIVFSDDYNFILSTEMLLRRFVVDHVKSGDKVEVVLASRLFNIRLFNMLAAVANPFLASQGKYHEALKSIRVRMSENYLKKMQTASCKWEAELGRLKKTDVQVSIARPVDYELLCLPDMLCGGYRAGFEGYLDKVSEYDLKYSSFYKDYVDYGLEVSYANEIKHIGLANLSEEQLVGHFEKMPSLSESEANKMLGVLFRELGPLLKSSVIEDNAPALRQISECVKKVCPNEILNRAKIFGLLVDFNVARRVGYYSDAVRIASELRESMSPKDFDDILQYYRFYIDFEVKAIQDEVFGLIDKTEWEQKKVFLIEQIEKICFIKERIGAEHIDELEAKLYGALGQGNALFGCFHDAIECFQKKYQCNNVNVQGRAFDYIATLCCHSSCEVLGFQLPENIKVKLKDLWDNAGSVQANVKVSYELLNQLKRLAYMAHVEDRMCVDEATLLNVSAHIREGGTRDRLLYFLLNKWIAYLLWKCNCKTHAVTMLQENTRETRQSPILELMRCLEQVLLCKFEGSTDLLRDVRIPAEFSKNTMLSEYHWVRILTNHSLIGTVSPFDIAKGLPYYYA